MITLTPQQRTDAEMRNLAAKHNYRIMKAAQVLPYIKETIRQLSEDDNHVKSNN